MSISKTEIISNHMERFNNFEAALDLISSAVNEIKEIIRLEGDSWLESREKIMALAQVLESVLQKSLNNEERLFLKGFVMRYVLLCEELRQV